MPTVPPMPTVARVLGVSVVAVVAGGVGVLVPVGGMVGVLAVGGIVHRVTSGWGWGLRWR